jgi:hypothetical protein
MALNHKAMNSNGFLCHSNVTEETMSASLRLSLALGFALSLQAAAHAAAPSHHHYSHTYRGKLIHRAAAPAPAPAVAPSFGLWSSAGAASHRQFEVEGLSRNPDDCARYGCIGNN